MADWHIKWAVEEGYDAITAYTWPGLGMGGETRFAPFGPLLDGYRRQWEHLRDEGGLPLLPPVCGGWDSRPWHGLNNLVRYGRTPALFEDHLRDARRVVEASQPTWTAARIQVRSPKSEVRNPNLDIPNHTTGIRDPASAIPTANPSRPAVLPMVLIEAWNEWGEGSYIEPHREFGFGYLDAIRAVFTDVPRAHVDVTPADVGLGPYDVPEVAPGRTAWSFEENDQGWGSGMNLTDVHTMQSVLHARTSGTDPAFFSPPFEVVAAGYASLELRMRLDPCSQSDVQVSLEHIRLAESNALTTASDAQPSRELTQ